MAKYNQRVQNTPRTEQEMAAIQRTNADLTKQQEALKTNLAQANLAQSLESSQRGTQFAIIDAANYPLEPATPSRKIVLMLGALISLGAGLAAAIISAMVDQSVWTQPELERFLNAPVLVEIPKIASPSDLTRERRRKLAHATLLVLCAGIYLGGIFYLYVKQPPALRVLNPVVDKMMERMIKQ